MSKEKIEATKAEVQRLLDAGFIGEVTYLQWLANIVMVHKKKVRWRMCTNITDLNKWCMKDDFPLAKIDRIINSAVDCDVRALLECF
jgi:hypothetical protein